MSFFDEINSKTTTEKTRHAAWTQHKIDAIIAQTKNQMNIAAQKGNRSVSFKPGYETWHPDYSGIEPFGNNPSYITYFAGVHIGDRIIQDIYLEQYPINCNAACYIPVEDMIEIKTRVSEYFKAEGFSNVVIDFIDSCYTKGSVFKRTVKRGYKELIVSIQW